MPAGTIFWYSHRFHHFPVLAQILQFFGTRTDSTIFRYSPGQFFDTHRDSTFSRYSLGFHHILVVTQIRPFSCTLRDNFSILVGFFYLFPVLARILLFFGTHTDSALLRYSPAQFFDTRTVSIFSWYTPAFYHFSVIKLIRPFSRGHRDNFSILAHILPFPGSRPDSTTFRNSH